MKRLFAVITVFALIFAAIVSGCAKRETRVISVDWSEGVEGVEFIQDNEQLFPRNGVIYPLSEGDIQANITLKEGYKQSRPVLKVDGEVCPSVSFPATSKKVEVIAMRNRDIKLTLGEGIGYKLNELKRIEEEIGFTSVIGIFLDEGYRVTCAPKVKIIVSGAEYEAVSSLAEWGLDGAALKNEGYHSFYKVRVLENTQIAVIGVAANSSDKEEHATVKHIGGEGYTLRAILDINNDGISDNQFVISGASIFVKGTILNLMIYRDSAYSAKNAKLFVNGTEIIGTQGDGTDLSDPLSNGLIYCIPVWTDMEITVTGIMKLGQFTVHIMNSDGTQRYRTFCRADNFSEALLQIPGNDAREDEAYSKWWEPNPGAGYSFKYWRFDNHEYIEISESYIPELYEDVYCGYVRNGTVPTDPGDRPTVPQEPDKPKIPDITVLPQSLKNALGNVASLSDDELVSKQWVLAWATYQLYKAGAADLGRPTVFKNVNIYDDYYDDVLPDYKGPAANNLWVYAYDLLKEGSSEISVENQLKSSFINPTNGTKRSWANNEALVIEIVKQNIPEFEPKTSFTIGNTDDLNMTLVLLLDRLNIAWTLLGTPVSRFNAETYRAYIEEHATEGVMANVVKEVFDYIDSLGN